MSVDVGNKQPAACALTAFAGLAVVAGQTERAARLLGAAEGLLSTTGIQMDPTDRADFDHVAAQVRAGLDEPTLAALWVEGKALSLDQAAVYALDATHGVSHA